MEIISLNGVWECWLPDNRRIGVPVPGCWDKQIEQKDIDAPVHFKRDVDIDFSADTRYFLFFGGVSYYCDVYVNGRPAGSHEGIWDNFRLEVTQLLKSGENIIELDITKPGYRSDSRFPIRQVLSGFIPDVLCTFGGIWDDVRIECCREILVCSHYAGRECAGWRRH